MQFRRHATSGRRTACPPSSVTSLPTSSPTPHLAPLLDVVDDYERYAVALVDKERARLFTVFMAQIEEGRGPSRTRFPGKHHQGGPSQMKYQRDHEKHVLWHLKRVVEELCPPARTASLRPAGRCRAGRGPPASSGTLLPHELARRLVDVVAMEVVANPRPGSSRRRSRSNDGSSAEAEEAPGPSDLLDAVGAGGLASRGARPRRSRRSRSAPSVRWSSRTVCGSRAASARTVDGCRKARAGTCPIRWHVDLRVQ